MADRLINFAPPPLRNHLSYANEYQMPRMSCTKHNRNFLWSISPKRESGRPWPSEEHRYKVNNNPVNLSAWKICALWHSNILYRFKRGNVSQAMATSGVAVLALVFLIVGILGAVPSSRLSRDSEFYDVVRQLLDLDSGLQDPVSFLGRSARRRFENNAEFFCTWFKYDIFIR